MDWYEENIEKEIRSAVKLLRDNGFNTEASCGHDMYIQCQYIPEGEIQRLHNLLYNAGYRDYVINMDLRVQNGEFNGALTVFLNSSTIYTIWEVRSKMEQEKKKNAGVV